MNPLSRALAQAVSDLEVLGLRWALVGGIAVSVRSRPRTTEDLDIAVAVRDDREAERIVFSFRQLGYRSLPEHALEQEEAGRLAAVRFLSADWPHQGVDLLFASSGIEQELVAAATLEEILPGLVVPVARTGHLIALKVLAGREVDVRDGRWLWEAADGAERQLARDALELITARRFNRGKNLALELARVLAGSS